MMAIDAETRKASGGHRVSLEMASQFFDWSSIALAIGACIVFVATVAIVWLGIVKEHHWDLLREHSNEKISAVGLDAAKANAELAAAQADIAKASAQIAEANARQKEAELKLEQLRDRLRPRTINGAQFVQILESKPKMPVAILFVRDDPECFQLSMEIRDWLRRANWEVNEPRAIETRDITPRLAQYTSSMGAGGQPQGVTVVMRASSPIEFEREMPKLPFDPDEPLDTPRKALSRALGESLGHVAGGISDDIGAPGMLWVVVGPKPNMN